MGHARGGMPPQAEGPSSEARIIVEAPQACPWGGSTGAFFFRYRNALFPVLFILTAVTSRPAVLFRNPLADRLVVSLGVLLALLGELVRLTTIGYDYIERGGKNRRVYASRLVQGGMYAQTRNPMYLGNGLIAIGATLTTGSPVTYVTVIPFFLFVYWSIIVAEEAYLREHFGQEYAAYCRRVPRVLPSSRGLWRLLASAPYDWRVAVRKELSTMAGLSLGLAGISLCRSYLLEGWAAARAAAPWRIAWMAATLALYGLLVFLKKRRWLFY